MSDCSKDLFCDNLCLIIDLDGYTVQGRFEARELGYYSWQGDRGGWFFDVTVPYKRLTRQEQYEVRKVKRDIMGLPYRPLKQERPVFHQRDLNNKIWQLYQEFSTDVRRVVGFKGGHFEKDILVKLKIPYKDLEKLRCPKYDILRETITSVDVGCGCHFCPEKHHCPQVECEAFWEWTRNKVFS